MPAADFGRLVGHQLRSLLSRLFSHAKVRGNSALHLHCLRLES